MCAGAIINARIPVVVYGAADPKAGSLGSLVNLFSFPYNHHPEVVAGVMEDACAEVLRDFFRQLRRKKRALGTATNIDKTGFSGYDRQVKDPCKEEEKTV